MQIPNRIADRLVAGIKRFQPILAAAKSRDVNESDTVIIVTDILSEILGYDKYTEITSEHAVRGTFCDLATRFDGKIQCLLEVKAIGLEIKDPHVKQAVDYAANQGVDWVVLTNGAIWRVYKVIFGKPIDQDLVFEFDFLSLNFKNDDHLLFLYLISKEGWLKKVLGDFHEQRQALSRFFIAATILSDPVLDSIRRELRRACPDVKIQNEHITNVLVHEVLKREVLEGDKAEEAKRKLARAANRALRNRAVKDVAEVSNAPAGDGSKPVENSPPPSQT